VAAIAEDVGFVGRVFLECGNGLFGAALLRNTDDGVEDENREDLELLGTAQSQKCELDATYHGRVNKGAPAAFIFKQGEDE
jgi:hypothetical protein